MCPQVCAAFAVLGFGVTEAQLEVCLSNGGLAGNRAFDFGDFCRLHKALRTGQMQCEEVFEPSDAGLFPPGHHSTPCVSSPPPPFLGL